MGGPATGKFQNLKTNCDGQTYAVHSGDDSLWSVDTGAGLATRIGPLGQDVQDLGDGMDFDNATGVLHIWLQSFTAGFGRIDTATGQYTRIGSSPVLLAEELIANACANGPILKNGFEDFD